MPKRKKRVLTEAKIIWIDSEYHESDGNIDEKVELKYIHTIGWLIYEGQDRNGIDIVRVAQEIDPNTGWCRRMTDIPQVSIEKIEKWEIEI